jgi:hypothetical protein
MSASPPHSKAILYCHCRNTQLVSVDTKTTVLRRLCESSLAFEAVPDLCELAARRDSSLQRFATMDSLKIAACSPRAVQWLMSAACAPLAEATTQVLNLRAQTAEAVADALLDCIVHPNLPSKTRLPADQQDIRQGAARPLDSATVSSPPFKVKLFEGSGTDARSEPPRPWKKRRSPSAP